MTSLFQCHHGRGRCIIQGVTMAEPALPLKTIMVSTQVDSLRVISKYYSVRKVLITPVFVMYHLE